MSSHPNGAEVLVKTLLAGKVDVCFANPGTSEMQFVAALDKVPGMRCVLGLFEGVVTGAADGYARMADRPAATLLHLGPGLANGLANIHNAKRGGSPMVNIVGEHATWHKWADAPLHSDIEALARPMSHWVRTSQCSADIARDAVDAVNYANSSSGRIATLILPADTAWEPGPEVGTGFATPALGLPVAAVLDQAAKALADAAPGQCAIMLSGRALRAEALATASRIAEKTGARLLAQQSNARTERGVGRVSVERVPYPVDQALAKLQGIKRLILIGAKAPVSFFAYPGKPSSVLPPDCEVIRLAGPAEDLPATLSMLAERVGATKVAPRLSTETKPALPTGRLTADAVLQAVGALLPEQAILVDEAVTSGRALFNFTGGSAPHDYLQLTGGAIGDGLPMATGAAIACPDRKVISLEGDGSGMYTLQALWTQAREKLNVLTIVFANRGYQILKGELKGVGVDKAGEQAERMLTIASPELDWVGLAKGMGVDAAQTDSADELVKLMRAAIAKPGPFLIQANI